VDGRVKPGHDDMNVSIVATNSCQCAFYRPAFIAIMTAPAVAQTSREPYGIGLEGFAYPYPVNMLALVNDGEPVRMPIWT